ncbi:hypothetical protein WJX74_007060 [Apatococcus lobatus]|uniref:Uncharacterized protein n=1 Tax=Apatococcus lobatus TaxID=904363 RepID=A0AAW1RAQ8_9CHLO
METPEAQWVAQIESRLGQLEKESDEKDRKIARLERELQGKVSKDQLTLLPGTCVFSDGAVLSWILKGPQREVGVVLRDKTSMDFSGLSLGIVLQGPDFERYMDAIVSPTGVVISDTSDKDLLGVIGEPLTVMHSIIEPRLNEIFQIGPSTPFYTSLLELVPLEFVGCPDKLRLLTEHLCREMAGAFRTNGRSLPPWRRSVSMLRKWDSSTERRQPTAGLDGEPCQQSNASLAEGATQCGRTPPGTHSPVPEPWAHLLPPIVSVKPAGLAKPKNKHVKQKQFAGSAMQGG